MYANVVIEYPVKSLDKAFTYKIPSSMGNELKPGMKVIVPFGKQLLNGIVENISNNKPDYETKGIIRIDNVNIYLNEEQMKIGKFIKESTLCTLISAYQAMLPSALKIKDQKHNYDKYDTYISLRDNENEINKFIINNPKKIKQIEILDRLKISSIDKTLIKGDPLNNLIKLGLVKEEKVIKHRIVIDNSLTNSIKLNEEQQNTFNIVKNNLNNFNTYLLKGVTGSGKTEVYMQLIKEVIDNNKTAIVLVPEICLTTQTVERFYKRFGNQVAVFHSGLSNGEKYDEYLKIYNDEVKIVVGTRSSIFVPLKNLGIIIIDEEHSDTYKQDSNPRYDAIEVAKYRAKLNEIPLILASATPTLESMSRAIKNVYKLLELKERANGALLPTCTVVNMVDEIKKRNVIFSSLLKDKIKQRLDNNEQIMLLLNRRGFSTFVNCTSCGYTYKCPNCDITLTYHKSTNNLRCHYCGYAIKKDINCPKCHEDALNYLGLGTQKVEEELLKIFPNAKVIRMDQDTTSKKGSFQNIIDDFEKGKYDILLGTQMISKGLDFKNVTLVGIINADTSLNIPDFRSNEKTFQLLYQTSGRSGRDKKKGEVIIQTFNPDNEVLQYVKDNDYMNFFKYEMNIRHKLMYPPYTYIALIKVISKNYEDASNEANKIKKLLVTKLKKSNIYGPTPASIFRVNNLYHFNITIKYTFENSIKDVLKEIDDLYILNKSINIEISFNPGRF